MPLFDIQFSDHIFFCRESGHINKADAQEWARLAAEYAGQMAPEPIIAVVDARQVQSVSLDARRILARASAIQGLAYASIATETARNENTSRIIAMQAAERHTHIFVTLAEAQAFAREKLIELLQAGV